MVTEEGRKPAKADERFKKMERTKVSDREQSKGSHEFQGKIGE